MPLNTAQVEDIFVPREENIKSLLSSILKLNLNQEENEKIIVNSINRLLGQAKHRKEGLDYLMLILNNCSSEVLAKNAVLWISHCIVKYSDDVLREKKLRALAKLIENAYNEADFNKKFVSEYISKVVDACLETSHVNPYECKAALATLIVCMKCYPSWFTSHKQKIDKFLFIFLDHNNEALVRIAAQAFHYLQQVGGAGTEGINHKTNFTNTFHKLCDTVNNLFNKLLEGDTEIFQTVASSEDIFKFQDEFVPNLPFAVARRIKNCLTFIELMIRTKFPVCKEIQPKKIIELLTRGTSLHRCISKEQKSLEAFQESLILTGIQVKLLRILRLFIIWFGTNSLPFSYPISKMLLDNLERCQSCDCFKHESLYQESTFKAIDEWLKIAKSSLHPNLQEQLIKCILKDITPLKSQVTLNISESTSKSDSSKQKRKSIENKIISSGQGQGLRKLTLLEQTNAINNCKFALGTLKCLLQSTRLDIINSLLTEIYKSVFDTVATIQLAKHVHPYTDAVCQARLYEVLVAFYHQDQLSVLPPLQATLDFLTRGSNKSNRFISSICEKGIQTLEVLCQPVCPSLYGSSHPQQVPEEEPLQNGYTNGVAIEFSPEHSPEPQTPEISPICNNGKQSNQDAEEIDVVSYDVIEAENDNNVNMEIEQQAVEIQGVESSHSDSSLTLYIEDDDIEIHLTQKAQQPIEAKSQDQGERQTQDEVVEDEIIELDSEEPPAKKLKPVETDEDDIFEENKGYNLRSGTIKNTKKVEKESVSSDPKIDSVIGINQISDKEVEVIADANSSADRVNTETSNEAHARDPTTAGDISDNNKSVVDGVEDVEEDDFVDKVLDSFVDEVKEY